MYISAGSQKKPKTEDFMDAIRAMHESGTCSGLSLHWIDMRIPRSQNAPWMMLLLQSAEC
jgi:hypothetical protein